MRFAKYLKDLYKMIFQVSKRYAVIHKKMFTWHDFSFYIAMNISDSYEY